VPISEDADQRLFVGGRYALEAHYETVVAHSRTDAAQSALQIYRVNS
jgi:hypothetical protein